MTNQVLFVFGTRPEAIKLAPIIKAIDLDDKNYKVKICVTAQHRSLLDQVLNFFDLEPDFDLDIMRPDQSLFELTENILRELKRIIADLRPNLIFVQGDTTTAFVGALAGYYSGVKVAHVEAGLRSGNKWKPFPEEMNRILVGHLSDFHFAPTEQAKMNLLNEGISKNVWVVGNTVIDALLMGFDKIKSNRKRYYQEFPFLDFSKKIILVTGHRRESFGPVLDGICEALVEIAQGNPDVELVYPVHLNPNVQEATGKILKGIKNIHLIEPLNYPKLIWLMEKSYLIITDSGGLQEEAPSLGKPVLVIRDVTERMEGIIAGTAKLVGTHKKNIIETVNQLLDNISMYTKMANAVNPYGDGKSSDRILGILKDVSLGNNW